MRNLNKPKQNKKVIRNADSTSLSEILQARSHKQTIVFNPTTNQPCEMRHQIYADIYMKTKLILNISAVFLSQFFTFQFKVIISIDI